MVTNHVCEEEEEKEEDFRIDSEVRCEGVHPLCGALSRLGLNPIKLAYAGWPAPYRTAPLTD